MISVILEISAGKMVFGLETGGIEWRFKKKLNTFIPKSHDSMIYCNGTRFSEGKDRTLC